MDQIKKRRHSSLCWAFATSTVIRAELKRIIFRLYQNNIITDQERDQALREADQINKENRLDAVFFRKVAKFVQNLGA